MQLGGRREERSMHAMGVRKRGRIGAVSVLPSPSQETNPDRSLSTATME